MSYSILAIKVLEMYLIRAVLLIIILMALLDIVAKTRT